MEGIGDLQASWFHASFVMTASMSSPPGFSRRDPIFFLYINALRLRASFKTFFRVLDVILLCLRFLWSAGVAEPHRYVLSLCVHAFGSKQRKRKKFVAAVEAKGDNYDNPVRLPVAFLCINFCMKRGGGFVLNATLSW